MTGKTVPIAALIAVVAAAAAGWLALRPADRSDDALVLYGNIDIRQVELSFHDPEHIAEVKVEEGDRVAKGDLLAVQDLERFQLAVEGAEARLQTQRHVVERLENGSRPEDIRKARADVAAAEAAKVFAEQEARRMTVLAARRLASFEDADRAEATLDEARARLMALREVLALAVAGPREEDIAAAKAELKSLEAAAKLARKALRDAHLIAPADGIIQARILEPGDLADATTPVFTLALTDPVWARTYVPETALGKLRLGMPAHLESDSHPGKTYGGWVGFISPSAEFTPKSVETPELRTSLVYQVRVFACNPGEELRLGMPVTVTIPLAESPRPPDTPCREAP